MQHACTPAKVTYSYDVRVAAATAAAAVHTYIGAADRSTHAGQRRYEYAFLDGLQQQYSVILMIRIK